MTRDAVHLGVARLELHLPGSDSLKARRSVLRRIQAALRDELGASVAEVGGQNSWQRAVLGVAVAASTATGVDRVLERMVGIVERDPRAVCVARVTSVGVLDADERPDWMTDVLG